MRRQGAPPLGGPLGWGPRGGTQKGTGRPRRRHLSKLSRRSCWGALEAFVRSDQGGPNSSPRARTELRVWMARCAPQAGRAKRECPVLVDREASLGHRRGIQESSRLPARVSKLMTGCNQRVDRRAEPRPGFRSVIVVHFPFRYSRSKPGRACTVGDRVADCLLGG